MDVFRLDRLPLELVAFVLDYLPSEDLVNCLHVSSDWRRVVGSFRGLWGRRCRDYGLPDRILQDDPLASFLSARRQRNCVRACKHSVFEDLRGSGGSSEVAAGGSLRPHQVVYAGNGVVVTAMFRAREGAQQTPSGPGLFGGGGAFTPYNELKHRYQFECILIERLDETGVGKTELCRDQLEDKWKWPILTKAFAAKNGSWVILRVKETWIKTAWYKIALPLPDSGTKPSIRTLMTPDSSSEHHPSIPYDASCCSNCSTVALVKNKLTMRPPWEFGIDLLHLGRDHQLEEHTLPILNYDKMRLSSDVHANVVFKAFFICREPSTGGSMCKSHKLVLWRTNDHTITVHRFSNEEGVSQEPDTTFSPVPQGKTLELSTAWGNAKMKISADFTLLGFLLARHLHLWSLDTNQKLSTVYLEGIPGLRSWMLALGHVYSLFGTLHEGGEMVVVVTRTGEVVWRCESFLGNGRESNVSQLQVNGVVHEDWMSDVYRLPPSGTPFLLYSSMNSPTYVSGLAFTCDH